MNIILFSKKSNKPACINIDRNKGVLLAVLTLAIPLLLVYGGYKLNDVNKSAASQLSINWDEEMQRFRSEIDLAAKNAQYDMNGLVARLGQLQAQVIRLNAVGSRLVDVGKLDKGEFDFENVPAVGGPKGTMTAQAAVQYTVPDFIETLNKLSAQLEDREQQLQVMETFYISRSLRNDVTPAGRPIKKGWTSSYYGMRTDPFTGLQEMHKGMDFAGKDGSDVVAVAAGVVTWSGKRYGYGNMVELNHGNGYVTRYAHSKTNVVHVGDTVEQGQTLALMGSSGRSTGPHVHLEVLHKGKVVDPAKYIYAKR